MFEISLDSVYMFYQSLNTPRPTLEFCYRVVNIKILETQTAHIYYKCVLPSKPNERAVRTHIISMCILSK